MPWYYAGPEARPVGPITIEELQTRRVNGTISPETYVIEQTGQTGEARAWKRYREIFPASPTLPPLPPLPPSVSNLTPPPQPVVTPHPLFPSAAPVPGRMPGASPPIHSDPYYAARRMNAWCGWGFGLGLASPVLLLLCLGLFTAPIAIVCCLVGLVQVHHHREQTGRGMAYTGLIFAALTLIVALVIGLAAAFSTLKVHAQTVTEQTSNDSP
jgi:hypothetical protein